MINGVPVVTTPAEIDVTIAEQLRLILLRAAARRQATVVVDMTRTRVCDPAGLTVLARAHKRAQSEGGGLRLIIPSDGAVARILVETRLDCAIPLFRSLEEAWPRGSVPGSGHGARRRPLGAAGPGRRAARGLAPVAQAGLEASVTDGPSGPVIRLSGETDLMSLATLSALLSRQLSDGALELTIDASGLRFADTASIRTLVLAARTLSTRGGRLILLHPQQSVAKVLELLGADQMLTIRGADPGRARGDGASA